VVSFYLIKKTERNVSINLGNSVILAIRFLSHISLLLRGAEVKNFTKQGYSALKNLYNLIWNHFARFQR
jgi:hypothetical protein